MQIEKGAPAIIDGWMALVERVRAEFPGLETPQAMEEHRQTVLRFMERGEALCARADGNVAGVILFSRRHGMICCLAVAPEFRRRGAGSMLLSEALRRMDCSRPVTVSTFLEDDPRGPAARGLYRRFGFVEGAFSEEYGSPVQEFVRAPQSRDYESHRNTTKTARKSPT